jgi:beta-1,4-N-acetylglucosaminyltransferase
MMVVLGSGGHTAEMMSLLRDIDPGRYTQRTYIVSSGDSFSSGKAEEIESLIQSRHINKSTTSPKTEVGNWDVKIVPRARKIHQPLYSTPFSALWCLIRCLQVVYEASNSGKPTASEYPDVIITNGPATAVIVILAANLLKFFGFAPLWKMKTIYVESWARVKSLSLSGKILLRVGICDRFLVQWETLAANINGNRARRKVEWIGFLVD